MIEKIPINKNGLVQTTLDVLFTPTSSRLNKITLITFNNTVDAPYTLEVWLHDDNGGEKLMYKAVLDAGDFITDTVEYFMASGTKLLAKSDVATVAWTINGIIE